MNLASPLAAHALHRGDRIAWVDLATGRRQSYRTFAERCFRLANALRELGMAPGDRCGLLLGNQPEYLEVTFGLAAAGLVAVPLSPRATLAEHGGIVGRHGLRALIGDVRFFDAAGLRRRLNHERLEHLVVVSGASGGDERLSRAGALDYETLLGGGSPEEPDVPVDETSPALILLSSGTTGRPKGVIVSQGQMLARLWTQLVEFGFGPGDRYLAAAPLYHSGGRSFATAHLFLGGTVYLLDRFDAQRANRAVRDHRITTVFLVPTMLERIRHSVEEESPVYNRRAAGSDGEILWPSIRVLISSGAALHPETYRWVVERLTPRLFINYASAEGGSATVLTPEDGAAGRWETVGRPAWGVEVKLFDGEDELPPGSAGEVGYRGPGTASGYEGADPGDASFRKGWFFPGEIGRIDNAGFLTLLGRKKEMIVTGGLNVFPGEIEEVLRGAPGVKEAAVAGLPDREWGEVVWAFIVSKEDEVSDPQELLAWCRQRLAGFKVPKGITFLRELPYSEFGKLLRGSLVEIGIRERRRVAGSPAR